MNFKPILISKTLSILLTYGIAMATAQAQLAPPLPHTHAHNDYAQHRAPLLDALRSGMTSIEIDVYVHRGQLKVAHLPFALGKRPDLETLYILPLRQWLATYQTLYSQPYAKPLIWMIDIKSQPDQAYKLLKTLALKHTDLLTAFSPSGDTLQRGRVEWLLSGKKPWAGVGGDTLRYMRLDGGLAQIGDTLHPAAQVPRVSCRYPFRWKGKGAAAMPDPQLLQLRHWVRTAHADGRQLRFWAAPNNPKVWTLLHQEGVDWLHIDALPPFMAWAKLQK